MAKSLQEKNAMNCNKEARARYNSGYNKKMGLRMVSVRFKEEDDDKINKYCEEHKIIKADLVRNAVLNYINQ